MSNPNRNRCYTLLQVGKSDLQWDDDFYRKMLTDFGAKAKAGKISASTMSISQMEQLITHMKRHGFKVKRKPQKLSADMAKRKAAQKAKITAIWCCLHEHGVIHNRSESAMEMFIRRFNGNKPPRWATEGQLSNAIEALKKMAERGDVDLKKIERQQARQNGQVPG